MRLMRSLREAIELAAGETALWMRFIREELPLTCVKVCFARPGCPQHFLYFFPEPQGQGLLR